VASTIYTQLDHLSLRPPTKIIHTTYTGWPQSKRKNPRVFHSHKLTFPHDITTKSKCNNDLHRGPFHINSSNTTAPSVLADIYWAMSLLPEITVILFTQSTAIAQIFVWRTKTICYNFSLRLHRIPRVFHVYRNPSIPGFPGLWPSWYMYTDDYDHQQPSHLDTL